MNENKYEQIRLKIEDCYKLLLPMGETMMLYLLGMAIEEVSRRETELYCLRSSSADENDCRH